MMDFASRNIAAASDIDPTAARSSCISRITPAISACASGASVSCPARYPPFLRTEGRTILVTQFWKRVAVGEELARRMSL